MRDNNSINLIRGPRVLTYQRPQEDNATAKIIWTFLGTMGVLGVVLFG